MKTILLIFLFLTRGSLAAVCLPDSLTLSPLETVADLRPMEEAADRFESIVGPELPGQHELTINLEPNNPRINAEIVKTSRLLVLSVWGGMLSHAYMNPETFLLLLCHEIGHFLGGPPLKSRDGWSSTEGQADYYSTYKCARDLGLGERDVTLGILNLARIYAQVTQQADPRLDRCDPSLPIRTNYGYPSVQCRLDTMLAGWRGKERPRCWFVP